MREIKSADLKKIAFRVLTAMTLSVASLCVAGFAFQIVAAFWVEPWQTDDNVLNKRPIVGILAVERQGVSYIASSYVKAAESSGARVVPIFIGQPPSYYGKIVDSVNGVLFPGGDADLWAKGGYGEAAYTLYQLIIQANQKGNHFPLYGICLGFEVLPVVSTAMSKDVLDTVNGTENTPMMLKFAEDSVTSHLYGSTPEEILHLLQSRNFTANHHSQCFTPSSLVNHNLTDTWRLLTTSQLDGEGEVFISSMEHVKYPQIFGTQFHPEKIPFEWNPENTDPHSYDAILANRWFFDYFVQQARLNTNRFRSKEEEKASLIYNFDPQFVDGYFEQMYFFETATRVPITPK